VQDDNGRARALYESVGFTDFVVGASRILTATISYITMLHMRTTVTLDPDVERLLRDAVRRSGSSFKEVLNRAVREGLAPHAARRGGKRFRVKARPMGLRAGIDAGALNRLAGDLELEALVAKQRRAR
jgi:hypothetical protein